MGRGHEENGYALCLDCGRAEAEVEEGSGAPIPSAIKQHLPLATAVGMSLKGGYCPGGFVKRERVQRNVRFIHAAQTDVFELQLPIGTDQGAGLALAAGLRESLAERLGAEVREIGVSVDGSRGRTGESRISAFLYDRASGGAGFSSRLAETGWFKECLKRAGERLSCVEDCSQGCPACILRPDINFREVRLNRLAGLELAQTLFRFLEIPENLQVFGPRTRIIDTTLCEWVDRLSRTKGLVSVALYFHGTPADWELADWPVDDLCKRLKGAGTKVQIVFPMQSLTDKEFGIAKKLDLHRLSTTASLELATEMPFESNARVVALIENSEGLTAVAASAASEAIPGPNWGLGGEAPLVYGHVDAKPNTKRIPREQLVKLSGSNAQLIRVATQLDGQVSKFGSGFWKLIHGADPLLTASIRTHGIRKATYNDRYLLTPLNIRLFSDVLYQIPGPKVQNLVVSTARASSSGSLGWAVFHSFTEDKVRRAVMQELLPNARIDIQEKSLIPHERSLQLFLGDGRRVTILLDQGFGAWRACGTPRHDFAAEPAKQMRSLISLSFDIKVETGREAPVVFQVDNANSTN